MAYKILEQNGVLNENLDGAAFNKFCFHRKNGIVPSVLNECAVQSSSNILTLETGLFAVQGFRIKITDAMSWGMLSSDKTGEYRLVFEIRLYSDRSVEGTFFTQPLTVPLITEDILRSEAGAYQIEIARFAWDGSSILSLKRTLYVLSTESGGSIHISQELGDSEEATVSQKVVTENLNKKLDNITDVSQAGNFGGAYILKTDGTQGMMKITNQVTSGTLPIRGNGGYITVGLNPNSDYYATCKKYVDDLNYALKDRTTDLERRMKNVESAALGNTYLTEEDTSAVYRKIVPLAVLPYAGIERLGGAVKGGGGSVTLFESPYGIFNDDEGILTVEGGAGGEYTFSGVIHNGAQVVLYDANFPEPIEAGEYEFFFEGDGTAWSIWNANITVYNADQSDTLYENYVSATNDARMSFTLEEDGIYTLYFSVIAAVGDIGTLTVRPKLVKKGDPIEKSPVTAIKVAGAQLFDETQITHATNSKGEVNEIRGVIENGYFKAMYGKYSGAVLWVPFTMALEAGTYTVSADAYIGSASPTLAGYMGLGQGNGSTKSGAFYTSAYDVWERKSVTVTLTEKGEYYLEAEGGGGAANYNNLDVRFKNIKIERGATATDFTPYQEPVTAYTVSQDIQDLDGYGLGISDNLHNYIDFENRTFVRMVAERAYQEGDANSDTMLTDDVTTIYALATPETVDISGLLTFDGVVEVEGGGEIIAENALALAIPSTVLYQVKI